METYIARFFSIVFSPIIIPTLGVLVLFNIDSYISYSLPDRSKMLIMLIVFINTAIAPLIAVVFMKKAGVIGSLVLDKRKERLLPMISAVFFYFFTFYILKQANLPSLIQFYFFGATILVIVSLFITIIWKISLHMISMGGLTGLLIITALLLRINIPLLIITVILISGFVGSSRLKLNLHTVNQVFAGYLLGVSFMLVLFVFMKGG